MPFKRVTVPVDFDAPSHVALKFADAFCRPFGVELEALHVSDADHAAKLRKLDGWTEELGVAAATKVMGGNAAETIVDYMPSADLTIVGTHQRKGLAGFFLGSVAEKVVRMATRPVLVVPEDIDRTVPPKRILVPVDFSQTSVAAFELAVRIVTVAKSEIVALSVVEQVPGIPAPAQMSSNPQLEGTPLESYYDVVHRNTIDAMKELIRDRPNIGSDIRIAHPVDGICAAAAEHDSDLIVMGTRGMSGVAHFGSVAERTLRRAPCPVLVIHEGPAVESTDITPET